MPAENASADRARTRRRRRALWVLTFFALFALGGVAALGAAWWYFEAYQRPVGSGDAVERIVQVPRGAPSARIAQILHDEGLIHHPLVFRAVVRFQDLDGRLQAGEYAFSPAMSLEEIIQRLVRGEVVTYPFTVPEGLTVVQVIHLLDARGVAAAEELRAAVDAAAAAFPHLPGDASDRLTEPMEGYLFPDTYRVPRGTSAAEIVDLMLRGFERAFRPEWRARAEELGLSLHEVVTLASIIEREAQLEEERPLIAAVFHNRLRIGMKLDADPTVMYALGWLEGPGDRSLTTADLRVDSPYNTYQYAGLPPGPIASPGAASLEAALHPADVDYLYFVSTFDGTGAHVFARTYEEHLRNVRKYRDGR